MERYIKSISIKSPDGRAIVPPLCCTHCKSAACSVPCAAYEKEMRGIKCASFDMEWAIHSCWYQEFSKSALFVLLLLCCALVLILFLGVPSCCRRVICTSSDIRHQNEFILVNPCGDAKELEQVEESCLKVEVEGKR